MSIGWLVNDKLTCIPGTKTFWHDLLENIPDLINKAEDIDFYSLPNKIESDFYNTDQKPKYIIRNATFFRRMNLPTKTIALLQDNYHDSGFSHGQIDVCNNSTVTVFNSPYVYDFYKNRITNKVKIIPLGTDFDFFNDMSLKNTLREKYNFSKDVPLIIYIGDSSHHPKGFDMMEAIIENTNYNFCLVMKDGYSSSNPRVSVFNRIDHDKLRELINCSDISICTSKMETLHLAGMECAACNIPLLATNVGIYFNDFSGEWGHICSSLDDFKSGIVKILKSKETYTPRKYFFDKGLDKKKCMESWKLLVEEMTNE